MNETINLNQNFKVKFVYALVSSLNFQFSTSSIEMSADMTVTRSLNCGIPKRKSFHKLPRFFSLVEGSFKVEFNLFSLVEARVTLSPVVSAR